MSPQQHPQPRLILAPLRGITDCIYRTTLFASFSGWDGVLAPFIAPQSRSTFPDKMLKDVLPANNPQSPPLVPQLLHNQRQPFLRLCRRLRETGWRHLNWNLGCPAPQVVKKGRGSAMLTRPDEVVHLLESVLPELDRLGCSLSLKMRLGLLSKEESFALLPRLNSLPLKELTIHTRLGSQLYRGSADHNSFGRCLDLSDHPLGLNGDITTAEIFSSLHQRFPATDHWMIGRGAIARPYLAEEIKGIATGDLTTRLIAFHDQLFRRYSRAFSGDSHIIGRMKLIWTYFIASFPHTEKRLFKRLQKASTTARYLQATAEIFAGATHLPAGKYFAHPAAPSTRNSSQ